MSTATQRNVLTSVRLPLKLRDAVRRSALQDERTQTGQIIWLLQQAIADRLRQLQQQERTP
jgi:hypothetical protein